MQNDNRRSRGHRDEPTYWFAILEIAREQNDRDGITQAKNNLERLGVRVIYSRTGRKGGAA